MTPPTTDAAQSPPSYLQELQDHFGYVAMGSNIERQIGYRVTWMSGCQGDYETDAVIIGLSSLDEVNEQRKFLKIPLAPFPGYPFIYRVRAE